MTVYFIQAGENGPVKIGFTSGAVTNRLREIQTCNASECTTLRVLYGDKVDEKKLHKHFKHLNIRGEWFQFNTSMLSVTLGEVQHYDVRDNNKLKQWLSDQEITQAEFAQLLNWSQGTVSKIIKNGTNVLASAAAIERATGGGVSMLDLLPMGQAA